MVADKLLKTKTKITKNLWPVFTKNVACGYTDCWLASLSAMLCTDEPVSYFHD